MAFVGDGVRREVEGNTKKKPVLGRGGKTGKRGKAGGLGTENKNTLSGEKKRSRVKSRGKDEIGG